MVVSVTTVSIAPSVGDCVNACVVMRCRMVATTSTTITTHVVATTVTTCDCVSVRGDGVIGTSAVVVAVVVVLVLVLAVVWSLFVCAVLTTVCVALL